MKAVTSEHPRPLWCVGGCWYLHSERSNYEPRTLCSYPGETNQASTALAFADFLTQHGKFCKGEFSNVSSCKTVAKFKRMKDFDIVAQENRDNKILVSRESLEGCGHNSEAWSKPSVQMHIDFRPENQWSSTWLSLR